MQGARQMPKAIWIFLFLAEMDFVSLRSSSVLCGIASSDRFFLHQGSVLDQCEKDGELEEARILKALELSCKEVYDLEKVL